MRIRVTVGTRFVTLTHREPMPYFVLAAIVTKQQEKKHPKDWGIIVLTSPRSTKNSSARGVCPLYIDLNIDLRI